MSINQMLNELMIFGVFLIAGFLIREFIKPLQKLFIPASVIGGILCLVMGQQVLGLVTVPTSFASYSGALIRFVMTCLVFGVTINKDKIASYGDYMMVVHGVYGWQLALGVALGAALRTIWTGLPVGWGLQGVTSFYGGHGTAAASGAAFEQLGVEGVTGIGMVLSTFGLMIAMVCGMAVVNYGVRKGWAAYVKEPQKQPPHFYGGALPKEEQKSVGTQKTTSISVNALALQLGWILLSMWVGDVLFKFLSKVLPVMANVPQLSHGIVGALIVWPILKACKLDRFCDKKTINELSGLSLEVLILGAMATLSIQIITTFMLPLIIMTVVMTILTIAYPILTCKVSCKDEWFEKAIFIVGQSTGATPTGLALLRAIDPDNKSSVAEAHGIYSGITFWTTLFATMLPATLMVGIGFSVGVGLVQFVICALLSFTFFRVRKNKAMSSTKS